jgi:hypothetical protein
MTLMSATTFAGGLSLIQFPIYHALELSGETNGCFYYRLDNGRIKYAGIKGNRTISADELERILREQKSELEAKLRDNRRRWAEFCAIVNAGNRQRESTT